MHRQVVDMLNIWLINWCILFLKYNEFIKEHNVNENSLIIMNAVDNNILNNNVYCKYTLTKAIPIKMRKCGTIGELQYDHDEKTNINLNGTNLSGSFDSNINNLQNPMVIYLDIISICNDNNDLLYNYYNNINMLFYRITISKKILFSKSFGRKSTRSIWVHLNLY